MADESVDDRSQGRKSNRQRLGLAVASAVCMVLGCPAFDLWWLGFIAWVLWLAAFDGASPRRAFLYGWLTGTITVFWGFFWISELLTRFAKIPLPAAIPITLLFALWQGLLWGLPAALIVWMRRRTGMSLLVLAPLCWVAVEATLPNIFPVYMGLIWAWQPLWVQVADLGGPTTMAFVIVAINAAVYTLGRTWWHERRVDRRAAIALASLLVAVPGYGAIRMAQVDAVMEQAPKLRVGVVQPNKSIFDYRDRDNKPKILAEMQQVSADLQRQGAELIVWGETSYPFRRRFHHDAVRDLREGHPERVHVGFDAPLIFGAMTTDPDLEFPNAWNTAFLLGSDHKIKGRYDKVFRLVFGEYAPIIDPKWYVSKVPSAAHINKGDGPGVLELDDYRLGPLICYEDILPRFVRDTALMGVHAFINITNDSWFGYTDEPWQHFGLAVFRTIEQRRPMVRALNTGTSDYVDANGRVIIKTRVTDPDIQGPQKAEGFVAEVPMIEPGTLTTLYARTGELFNGLIIALLAFLGFRGRKQ